MEYELENAFSDIEEDENDAPLNVVPFLEEQNLREWVPVQVSEGARSCILQIGFAPVPIDIIIAHIYIGTTTVPFFWYVYS